MAGIGWLVVGLGNPGPDFARTRHNVGRAVVDELAARRGQTWRSHRSRRADVVETRASSDGALDPDAARMVLARPRCFMNESGGPVAALATFYKTGVDRIIVVHDEIDLPFAALRCKLGGGDNGHNGLRSVRSALGSGDFYRVRLGIGRPPGRQDPADFVLRRFAPAEADGVRDVVARAADAVESLITRGLARTQETFNSVS